MRKITKKVKQFSSLTVLGIVLLGQQEAAAQATLTGTSYMQTFDSLAASMPIGWSVDTGCTGSYLGNDVSTSFHSSVPSASTAWNNTTGHFKNVASGIPYPYYASGGTSANQMAQTNRALGIRQTATIGSKVGFIFAIANTTGLSNFALSFSLQSLDSTSGKTSTWKVDYALGSNPTSFISANTTGTLTTGGFQFSKNTINVDFGNALDNKTGPVYIRIVNLTPSTGSGSRATTAIDNYNLSWSNTMLPNLDILEKTPVGLNISLSTHELKIKFNGSIQAGTGQISVFKSGNPVATSILIPSPGVSITDSTATITGINLENNQHYFVLMPVGAFTKSVSMTPTEAITDSTYWTFSTIDTTTPQAPIPFTKLDETFKHCINTDLGNFVQYNVKGLKTWQCSASGHNDSSAVYMNGGSATGISEPNEDWLISAAPFDFSGLANPMLGFWQKRKFEGNVTRTVKISTNYSSGLNPDSATWTTLQVPDLNTSPSLDNWTKIGNINLTAYKTTPFYLAFTYTCGSDGAYELTYDDINVSNVLGIFTPSKGNIDVKVLGDATSEQMILGINVLKNTDLKVQLFDGNGRKVYDKAIKAYPGIKTYSLNDVSLYPGLCIIKIMDEKDFGVIKTIIK